MVYRVFSQGLADAGELARMVASASRFFGRSVRTEALPDGRYLVRLAGADGVGDAGGRDPVELTLSARATTAADWDAAARAEVAGQATGMATLAQRCSRIWEVTTADERLEDLLWMCSIIATVALGPVLPPDEATLYGVRGARERAERMRKG